jgi:ABC-2 type transport system permease protein
VTSVVNSFTAPGMWQSVWKLLRLRLVLALDGFRRARTRVKIRYIIFALITLMFFGFILFLSLSLLEIMQSALLVKTFGDLTPFLESYPSTMISVSALGILVTGFSVLLQVLYLSGDMDFLMSAPIPVRAVFMAKLIQAILPNFGIMCLFTLPVLYGLGISGRYNFLYYPLVLIVLVVISLAAAALASLLVMAAARIFPARRLAEVLGFIVATSVFALSQSARFINFDVNQRQMASFLNFTTRFNQSWSPLAWAGRGLVALGKADYLTAAGYLLPSLALSLVVFYAALALSERLYYTGWSSLQSVHRQKAPTRAVASPRGGGPALNSMATLIPTPIRAILIKDWLVYRRDLRNLSRLLSPLILGIVYAFSLFQSRGTRIGRGLSDVPVIATAISGIIGYADVALALFLGWMLLANLAGASFSHEGKNYWMLKAAPLSPRQLLTAKFLASYLPSLFICGVYVLVLQLLKGTTPWSAIMSLLATGLSLAGMTGIYLAFGVRNANFDWENPAQMNRAVGCLGSIAATLFLPVCFLLFVAPPLAAGLIGLPVIAGQLAGLLLGGAAGIAGAAVPLGLVEKRVPNLAEA